MVLTPDEWPSSYQEPYHVCFIAEQRGSRCTGTADNFIFKRMNGFAISLIRRNSCSHSQSIYPACFAVVGLSLLWWPYNELMWTNTPSLQYLGEYCHTYCTSHNNPARLQPKTKLPCFQDSKDASSLIFPNFFFFFHFSQAFDVFFHRATALTSDPILYS